jgi:hypothetical protein
MSRKGTVFPDPTKSNFQNCLNAVDACDLFLGIITPSYGSGKFKGEKSITHQEIERATERKPFRWFLADYRVDVARQSVGDSGVTFQEPDADGYEVY